MHQTKEQTEKGTQVLRKVMLMLAAALLAVLAVGATAVAQSQDSGETNTDRGISTQAVETGPSGETVIGRGSDTTYNISSLLGNLYTFSPTREDGVTTENVNEDVILNAPPQGSSVGIAQLADAADLSSDPAADVPTSFARSSRGPRDSDPKGLSFTAFARDAIVPVTFGAQGGPAQGVENLSLQQLRGIFVTCQITNFNQIGGDDAPIAVYTIQEGSGTRATFDQFLNGDSDNCIPPEFKDGNQANGERIIFENNANPILETDAGVDPSLRGRAIFPFSFARLSTSVPNEAINALRVNNVEANASTISNRSFPFTRDVYFVTVLDNRSPDDAAADRFVNWVCKPNSAHGKDPISGDNYGKVINNTILASGFGLRNCADTLT
jgi:phosphate transport system substrate-binding protein